MKLNVERKPASLVVLDITADEDEFAEAMTKAYRKVSKDVQIPGFRKGKAPRSMIERFYGREVFLREAADEVMDKLYRKALEQEDITPVGDPNVEINELDPVSFVVTVPVFPTINVNDYATVRIDAVDATVDDVEIDEVLTRLQKSQSTWVDPSETRNPREGDQVTVDYEVLDGETPFQEPVTDAVFILGETNLLTQLRDKLQEMTVGATDSFELAFAEDDDTADPSIRGKALSYQVTLKDVKERELVPLDDEFAKKVNEAATLEDLRTQIRDDIHQGKTTEGRTGVVSKIIDAMAEQAEIDPPAVMVEEEVQHQINHLKEDLQRSNTPWEGYLRLQGKTEDDVKDDLRPEAQRRLRNSLFLQEVAKSETVEVTPDDIDAEIARIAGPAPDGDDEEAAAQAERMTQFYQSEYFRQMLSNELFERKLTDRLIEIATEGQGAVLNAYVAPDPVIEAESSVVDAESSVADTGADTASAESATSESGSESDADDPEALQVDLSGSVPAPQTLSASTDAPDAESAETEANAPAATKSGKSFASGIAGDGGTEAPDSFPIKGNADSMIYHVPGGGSYDHTIAEWYFATPEDAESAGFRASKR